MSAPRRWARRVVLSALASSGLTAAGFGGPLVGGALAAEAQPGTTTNENPVPPVTDTGPQAPAATGEGSTSSGSGAAGGAGGAGGAPGTTTTTTNAATTTVPPESSSSSTVPAAPATPPAAAEGTEPTVVVQHSQQTTPGRRHGASTTGSGNATTGGGAGAGEAGANARGKGAAQQGPSAATAGAPNGVAPAPQVAGGESNPTLATLLAGSTVSAQALDFYRIPLFLLPVYQAAAFQYDVPWPILAAINEIETDYGADLSVSTAGALGWMQFMPGTWLQYGVDATDAGYADPFNPVDAIFAAARYLHAAGASEHLRAAIFAYNHSQEYVESVMLRAQLIASYPHSVIATLTGLVDGRAPTPGAHLAPGAAATLATQTTSSGASAADESAPPSASAGSTNATAGAVPSAPAPTAAAARALPGGSAQASAAEAGAAQSATGAADATTGARGVSAKSAAPATPGTRPAPSPAVAAARAEAAANAPAKASQLVDLLGAPGAPVVAAEDGRIVRLGHSHALGRYLVLRDIYGDLFTYAGLGSIAPRYRPSVPRPPAASADASTGASASGSETTPASSALGGSGWGAGKGTVHSGEPARDPAPTLPASAGHQPPLTLRVKAPATRANTPPIVPVEAEGEAVPAGMGRVRLFAHPNNPIARVAARRAAGAEAGGAWRVLRTGSVVSKGTVLGHLDAHGARAGQLRFAVRPAGDGATIDPQPLLQNWRQLGVALHPKGSRSTDTLLGATAAAVLAMSKGELERAVLADPGIQLDACGRHDVAAGAVDERVLAVLAFLSRNGLQPTVAAVRCPRGGDSASGLSVDGEGATAASADAALGSSARRAAHRRGAAVDITAINGIPLAGHQGPGSVTDATIRTLLTLRGKFAPHLIVSLMRYPEAHTTQALRSAWNHIHIEFLPIRSPLAHVAVRRGIAPISALTGELNEAQWSHLIGRIATLPSPTVAANPSSAAIRDPQAAPTNRELGARSLAAGG